MILSLQTCLHFCLLRNTKEDILKNAGANQVLVNIDWIKIQHKKYLASYTGLERNEGRKF